jgi:hypothetical protein
MPVGEVTTVNIVCDNVECPGNELDPADRMGWIFVTHEVYGEPVKQSVFCSSGCVSAAAAAAEDMPLTFLTRDEVEAQEARAE